MNYQISVEDLKDHLHSCLINLNSEEINLKIIQSMEKELTGKKKNNSNYSNKKISVSEKKQTMSALFDRKIGSTPSKIETEKVLKNFYLKIFI